MYRCEATSVAGFVQQLAVGYIANGYWFYVTGSIPEAKDPHAVDEKIIRQYGVDVSKWTRCRRKQAGLANVQYLRNGRFFVIIATRGEHPLFAAERKRLRDVREHPVHFQGYSIGCRRGRGGGKYHPSVRIQREEYRLLKARFAQIAVHRTTEDLGRELRALPFEPYAPVRNQLRGILRAINRRRKAAALELLPWDALRLRRSPVQPFGYDPSGGAVPNRAVPPETSFLGHGFRLSWTTMTTMQALAERRSEILRLAALHRAGEVRVFGSVARGEMTGASDVDLLIKPQPGCSLFDLGGLLEDLQELLGCRVDLVTEDGLKPRLRERVLREAIPL